MSLFDYLKIGAGIVIGAALMAGPAYLKGRSAGAADARTTALERTVEILKSRELTNAEISRSDAAALCAHLGLQDSDRDECVRRLAETDADAGDGGEDHDGR